MKVPLLIASCFLSLFMCDARLQFIFELVRELENPWTESAKRFSEIPKIL